MQTLINPARPLELSFSSVLDRADSDSTLRSDTDSSLRSSGRSSLMVIDVTVPNAQTLAAGALPSQEVILLDPLQNGLAQISQLLSDRHNIASLHIVSHGSIGSLQLGSETINLASLKAHSSQLNRWADALTPDADILLYGCEVAQGESGSHFVQTLSQLTGADVAASIDRTGSASLGGNWIFETQTGSIETSLGLHSELLAAYTAILANPTINYSSFTNTAGLELNGNAVQSGSALRLTSAVTNQAGSAFFTTPFEIDGNTSFETRFQFRLSGGQGTNGADGFTFMLQNSTAGIDALGLGGSNLGYVGAIAQSLAVKFDSFQNPGELSNNFIAVLQNGSSTTLASNNAPIDLNSGSLVNAWVDYNAASDRLDIFLSGSTLKPTSSTLSYTVDLAAVVGSRAFVGFSGATGGSVNAQDIENWEFSTSTSSGGGTGTTSGDGLRGEYFDNLDFTNSRLTRVDSTVNFNWGTGSPDTRIGPDTFSVRWTGQVLPTTTGAYTFFTTSDDGVRLFVNGQQVINRYVNQAPTEVAGTINLVAGQKYDIRLDYFENTGGAVSRLSWAGPGVSKQIIPQSQLFSSSAPLPPPPPAGNGTGLRGEYYDNIDFTNLKVTRTDATVNYNWGTGSPDSSIGADTFSVRWTGQIQPLYSETYTFFTNTDDGVRLFVNGQQVINRFVNQSPTVNSGTIALLAGQKYDIRLEYFENTGGAVAQLSWLSQSQTAQIIPQSQLFGPPPSVNPGTIVLGQNAITVNENAGTVNIRVDRINGSDGPASVNYSTAEGSAITGSDYTATNGFLQFASGETSKTVSVPILNDTTPEDTEQFGFGLGQTTGASLGTNRTALITILDDDAPSSFAFSVADYRVNENDGTATITLQRAGNRTQAASVNYATSNDTATAGSDYTAVSGTLNFAPGDSSKTFVVPILDDTIGERNETLTLTLSNPTSGTLGTQQTAVMTIADNDPGNFSLDTVLTGLSEPTAFDWSPDGQTMYIAQKQGLVRVARNGVLQSTPFIDLRGEVNGARDRGLLSIAVHPQLTQGSPYVYLLYSYDPPQVNQFSGLAGPDGVGNRTARLIRVTADVNTNYTTVVPNSAVVILGKNSLWQYISRPDGNSTNNINIPESGRNPDGSFVQDFLPLDSESHSIGTVKFGTDGFLYVSNGDGASYNSVDPRAIRVLDVNSLSGKILRIDPITGAAPDSNPFFDGDPQSNRSKVWQLGLRNPFRFTINKDNGQVYVGDVGWTKWEEVNTGDGGENFGWVGYEGGNPDTGESFKTGGYSSLQSVINFYNSGATVTAPIYAFQHGGSGGDAIAVGDFYTGNTFPAIYDKSLFITNLSKGTIDTLSFDEAGKVSGVRRFASNLFGLTQITTGPDSNLYYANLNSGVIGRWRPIA
ncbi:PA14 domain-containing protein [Phormidesmis sp. 146-33]